MIIYKFAEIQGKNLAHLMEQCVTEELKVPSNFPFLWLESRYVRVQL